MFSARRFRRDNDTVCVVTVVVTGSAGYIRYRLCNGSMVDRSIPVGTNTFYDCLDPTYTPQFNPVPYVNPPNFSGSYTYTTTC